MKIAVLAMTLGFCGCMQIGMLPYLDQGLTLQEFSKEKDEQAKFVANADAGFDRLWAAVQSGAVKDYKSEPDIVAAFGPPVIFEDLAVDGRFVRRALYRYTIQSRGPHKVYFYYENSAVLKVESI